MRCRELLDSPARWPASRIGGSTDPLQALLCAGDVALRIPEHMIITLDRVFEDSVSALEPVRVVQGAGTLVTPPLER